MLLFCQIKPTEVNPEDLENLCRIIQGRLFNVPHQRSLIEDLEICIVGINSIAAENATVAESSMSQEMIVTISRWLGNEERTRELLSSMNASSGASADQLSEQLVRDGKVVSSSF